MEHIVQFGINIDDETIKKTIEKQATNTVIDKIYRDVVAECGGRSYYVNQIYDMVDKSVNRLIEERKDDIIERAVSMLADRLARTKAAREAVAKMVENIVDGGTEENA